MSSSKRGTRANPRASKPSSAPVARLLVIVKLHPLKFVDYWLVWEPSRGLKSPSSEGRLFSTLQWLSRSSRQLACRSTWADNSAVLVTLWKRWPRKISLGTTPCRRRLRWLKPPPIHRRRRLYLPGRRFYYIHGLRPYCQGLGAHRRLDQLCQGLSYFIEIILFLTNILLKYRNKTIKKKQ